MPASNILRLTAALIAFAPLMARSSTLQQEVNLETLPQLRFIEEMRIGNSGDPNLGFTAIGDVVVDRDGQIFIFEARDLELRVYGAAGQRIRTIGRKGEGPGEFDGIYAIHLKGDSLWAIGGRGGTGCRKRIHLYNRSGVLLSTSATAGVRFPLQYDIGVVTPRVLRPDGSFVGSASCQTIGDPSERVGVQPNAVVRAPRVLFDSKGVPTDTLGWELLPPPVQPREVTIESVRHPVPRAPEGGTMSIQLADGQMVIERDQPRSASQGLINIKRVTLSGDTIATQSFRYTPRRWSAAQLDSIAERSAGSQRGMRRIVNGVAESNPYKDPAQARILIRSAMAFPEFKTPVQSYFLTNNGALWLQRENDPSGTAYWVLFDAQGRARGRLDLPAGVLLKWSDGNTVWAVRPDADDVPWLVKFRIAPS